VGVAACAERSWQRALFAVVFGQAKSTRGKKARRNKQTTFACHAGHEASVLRGIGKQANSFAFNEVLNSTKQRPFLRKGCNRKVYCKNLDTSVTTATKFITMALITETKHIKKP
jgi:hypothetical protein